MPSQADHTRKRDNYGAFILIPRDLKCVDFFQIEHVGDFQLITRADADNSVIPKTG